MSENHPTFDDYLKPTAEAVAEMLDPVKIIFISECAAQENSFGEEAVTYREKAEQARAIISSGNRSSSEWAKVCQLLWQACQAAYEAYHKLPYYHKQWPEKAQNTARHAAYQAKAALAYIQGHEAGLSNSAL